MGKHQCEYCCWYTEERGCECPYVMRKSACEKAMEIKNKEESYKHKINIMKRSIYFGTRGNLGHNFLPIEGRFNDEEIKAIEKIVDGFSFEKLFIGGYRYRWFNFEIKVNNEIHRFYAYGVPFSPDDERPGSKTIIIVENGNKEDIRNLFYSNKFLVNQFNRVWNEHKYSNDDRI